MAAHFDGSLMARRLRPWGRLRSSALSVALLVAIGCSAEPPSVSVDAPQRDVEPLPDPIETPVEPEEPEVVLGPLADPIELISEAQEGIDYELLEIERRGDFIATCSAKGGVAFYDASDPADVEVRFVARPFVLGVDRGRCQHLAIGNDFIVVSHHGDEIVPEPFIALVGVSGDLAGHTLSTYLGGGFTSFEGLALHGDILYVAEHDRGVGIYRVEADRSLSRITSVTQGLTNADRPVVSKDGSTLFVADAHGGFAVYSIAEPTVPRFLGRADSEGNVRDLVVRGGLLYTASGAAGVEIYDVADLEHPERIRRVDTPGSALGIDVSPTHLLVADWGDVQLFDLERPDAPARIGRQRAASMVFDVVTSPDGVAFFAEWSGMSVHQVVAPADAPDLSTKEMVRFMATPVGETTYVGMLVFNVGRRPLEVTDIDVPAPFSVSPQQLTIAPGAGGMLELAFTPQTEEPAVAELTLISTDVDEPEVRVSLHANEPMLAPGDEVPDLLLQPLDGPVQRLSELRGVPVFIAYFSTF